jgi:hypothetical protein
MVKNAEAANATLLSNFPSLNAVEGAVIDDCKQHADKSLPIDDYCRCGVAITMALWRTGVDPHLFSLLKSYVADPTSMAPGEFVKYQGPELYGPACKLALGH